MINLFLIVLGCIMFLIYIWMRFIRERLPRDIPYELSLYGFFIILYICCIYFYLIYITIFYLPTTPTKFKHYIDFIFYPLKALDKYIKHDTIFYKFHYKFIKNLIICYNFVGHMYIFYFFKIFIRFILIFCLSVDIFYFNHIEYFYKIAVPYGFLLFIGKYLIYSLKYAKELFIEELISMCDFMVVKAEDFPQDPIFPYGPSFYNNKYKVSVKHFINSQTETNVFGDNDKRNFAEPIPLTDQYKYSTLITGDQYTFNVYKNYSYLSDPEHIIFHEKLTIILKISTFLEFYEVDEVFPLYNRYIILVINGMYFITWFSILILCSNYVMYKYLYFLFYIQDYVDPFSNTFL